MRMVMEGSHAVAEAVRLVGPKVIAAYPITPQTHIVEKLAELVANGELDAEYLNMESEHSAMAACIGAQATGVRTYTATCSQGLALMWELLHVASGMRLPIVMGVTNRALSAPLNIWNDWSDAIGCRDTGWAQLWVVSVQEAFDATLQAYKIAESVQMPVMVCMDGFYLSHVYEPLDIATEAAVRHFVGDYRPQFVLDPANPISLGEYATPEHFQEFKAEQQQAMDGARSIIVRTNEEFGSAFGRKYGDGLIETFNMPAPNVIVTMGSVVGTMKHAIKANGIRDVGIVRVRSYRPFPSEELRRALAEAKNVGVFEKDVSLGIGGALWSEVKAFVDKPVASFVGGLGGRDIGPKWVEKMFNTLRAGDTGFHWIEGDKVRL
ncbi:MAG: pyruvate ferredoxin oxidoreductase [Candidatus Aenigmatarchaeota archaeon]